MPLFISQCSKNKRYVFAMQAQGQCDIEKCPFIKRNNNREREEVTKGDLFLSVLLQDLNILLTRAVKSWRATGVRSLIVQQID